MDVVALEERTLRAWPAAERERRGGWILRANGGYTRRANSVQPLGDPPGDLRSEIERVVGWYRERSLRPVFKVTPAAIPAGLDDALDHAGWVREAPTRVMTNGMTNVRPAPPQARSADLTELPGDPGPEWLDRFEAWNGVAPEHRAHHQGILKRIRVPAAFALQRAGGEPVGCGLGVADPPWLGLFDLVTAPDRRSRGHGTALVRALLAWGCRAGCDRVYLQVMDDNPGAIALYERLGFEDAYPYWYRIGP